MIKKDWFDNDTGTYFEAGDKVVWWGDENETKGKITEIGENTFSVLWEDGSHVTYTNDHQDAIKKA